MMQVIQSKDRYFGDHGWLQARWHFSFGDYHDRRNMNWSALRVFNDDVIQPGQGFPAHPHRDMEIVTYVLDGVVRHGDNLGNRGLIKAGEVQVMSAGRGIEHQEFNGSETEPVHLLQLWIMPRTRGNEPRWEQRSWSGDGTDVRDGVLHPVVSGDGKIPGTLAIDQDAAVYVAKLSPGQDLTHRSEPNRHAYLFVIDGDVTLNGDTTLAKGDQARIADEPALTIRAGSNAHLILLDLP
ncbi:MAG TPA: pirin family protein [Tepidisphaeraceae bacterium]|nr:pirin family protein [Tepidisphaeraceae bacterium]